MWTSINSYASQDCRISMASSYCIGKKALWSTDKELDSILLTYYIQKRLQFDKIHFVNNWRHLCHCEVKILRSMSKQSVYNEGHCLSACHLHLIILSMECLMEFKVQLCIYNHVCKVSFFDIRSSVYNTNYFTIWIICAHVTNYW